MIEYIVYGIFYRWDDYFGAHEQIGTAWTWRDALRIIFQSCEGRITVSVADFENQTPDTVIFCCYDEGGSKFGIYTSRRVIRTEADKWFDSWCEWNSRSDDDALWLDDFDDPFNVLDYLDVLLNHYFPLGQRLTFADQNSPWFLGALRKN